MYHRIPQDYIMNSRNLSSTNLLDTLQNLHTRESQYQNIEVTLSYIKLHEWHEVTLEVAWITWGAHEVTWIENDLKIKQAKKII